jgi:hypothetical protein
VLVLLLSKSAIVIHKCFAFFIFIQLRNVGLPLASSVVIWAGGMGCKVLEAGGGGVIIKNVIFSGSRVAGATATVVAVAVLMEVATILMAMAAAATVAMEVITDIPNITIYTEFTEVHSQHNT